MVYKHPNPRKCVHFGVCLIHTSPGWWLGMRAVGVDFVQHALTLAKEYEARIRASASVVPSQSGAVPFEPSSRAHATAPQGEGPPTLPVSWVCADVLKLPDDTVSRGLYILLSTLAGLAGRLAQ